MSITIIKKTGETTNYVAKDPIEILAGMGKKKYNPNHKNAARIRRGVAFDEARKERKKIHDSMSKEELDAEAVAAVLVGITVFGYELGETEESVNAIFDAAREANGRFVDMSNDEIREYCSDLDPEQMQGMVSLVHGRYFEEIVAEEIGGTLHEAKNHPDTDMTSTTGEEISIKSDDATADAIDHVETISPQDLGMDDQALYDTTANTLEGGSNGSEALIDGVIASTVSLGTISTIKAASRGVKRWNNLEEEDKHVGSAIDFTLDAGTEAVVNTIKGGLTIFGFGFKILKKAFPDDEPRKKDYCRYN